MGGGGGRFAVAGRPWAVAAGRVAFELQATHSRLIANDGHAREEGSAGAKGRDWGGHVRNIRRCLEAGLLAAVLGVPWGGCARIRNCPRTAKTCRKRAPDCARAREGGVARSAAAPCGTLAWIKGGGWARWAYGRPWGRRAGGSGPEMRKSEDPVEEEAARRWRPRGRRGGGWRRGLDRTELRGSLGEAQPRLAGRSGACQPKGGCGGGGGARLRLGATAVD